MKNSKKTNIANQGFTLVEVIISIAVLSILCVIFLQLFIKADSIADDAKVLDESIIITNNSLELLKGVNSVNDIKTSVLFEHFDINTADDVIKLIHNYTVKTGSQTKEQYVLELTLSNKSYDEKVSTQLYHVKAVVTNIDQDVLYEVTSHVILD